MKISSQQTPDDQSREPANRHCDAVVVTVKQPELHAAQLAFGADPDMPAKAEFNGIRFWYCNMETDDLEDSLRVAITMAGEDSNVPMATFMNSVLSYLRGPKLAMLTGMAAGVETVVTLGDVVVATQVTDYVRSRRTATGFRPRPRHENPLGYGGRQIGYFDHNRRSLFSARWNEFLNTLPPRFKTMLPSDLTERLPAVYKGVIMSGDWLIEDGGIGQWQDVHDDKVMAGDMESMGFASSCRELRMDWFVVRGIADFGQSPRPREWQFASSGAAAVVAKRFIEEYTFHRGHR